MKQNSWGIAEPRFSFEQHLVGSVKRGQEVIGLCPFHNDKTPSFSGNEVTGLWNCFAGCGSGNWSQFLSRLGHLSEKINVKKTDRILKRKNQIKEATYCYQNQSGADALKIIRARDALTGKKSFSQFSIQDGQWVAKGFNGELEPYRFRAWKNQKFVALVEGEKVADYLLALGVPATTTPGGASNWKTGFAKYFEDRNVFILPDHDPPEFIYAKAAFADIKKFAGKVVILELPGLEAKEDAVEWFEKRGGCLPLLKQLIMKEFCR